MDSKGGKFELPLTQGETIQIVRLTDNPEGLWLARNSDGLCGFALLLWIRDTSVFAVHTLCQLKGYSVLCWLFTDGYVKTEALEVDHSALKTQTDQIPDGAGEVYDDVGVTDVRLVYSHFTRCNEYRYSVLFC